MSGDGRSNENLYLMMHTFFKANFKKAFTSDSESIATQKYGIFCVAGKSQYISDDTFIIVQFSL